MKLTRRGAGTNAKGKGSPQMGKKSIVEVERKKQLARRLFWKFKRTKYTRGGKTLEQKKI